ncbi:MAG: beta-galactosidase [Anaerolineae bacterium]|nr:beta-galactosidase [Anaerolineae bacterium]MCB0255444.1 beta-galactosidase [Anaerolineae bacterium]
MFLRVVRRATILIIAVSLLFAVPALANNSGTESPLSPDVPFRLFFPVIGHNPVEFGYGIMPAENNPASAVGHVQALGLDWVKILLPWKAVEPQQGQYDWGWIDSQVNPYAAAGINVLLTISKAPDWARPIDDDRSVEGMPANPATYAAFVAQVAGRYAGRIQAIEVWSEQNIWYEVGGVGRVDPVAYGSLLRQAYHAIKATNPTLMVITGGLLPTGAPLPYALDDIEYLDQLYGLGVKGYFDAVGAHPGGYNCPALADWRTVTDPTALFQGPFTARHHSWCFLGTMEGYRNVMVSHGDGGKKIAATNFGWASAANPINGYQYAADNTFAEQAQWIVEAYQWGKNSGWVNLMILWNLDFGEYYPSDNPVIYWSLLRQSGPVPAYSAVASMPK